MGLMPTGYDAHKAAQALAYLIRGRGGRTDIIDVMKLAYLSDRAFMQKYDRPILFDDFYCMEHGPVESATYDAIKQEGHIKEPFSKYLTPRRRHEFGLARELSDKDFGTLSRAEKNVMDEILDQHRHRRSFELVDWVHLNCREWSNPRGTSVSLPYFEVWKALGRAEVDVLDSHLQEMRDLAQSALEQPE